MNVDKLLKTGVTMSPVMEAPGSTLGGTSMMTVMELAPTGNLTCRRLSGGKVGGTTNEAVATTGGD